MNQIMPVHPHVRGEYSQINEKEFMEGGSSPRAWGIPGDGSADPISQRFIPTCVGNTPASAPAATAVPVHPHVRGEYFFISVNIFF